MSRTLMQGSAWPILHNLINNKKCLRNLRKKGIQILSLKTKKTSKIFQDTQGKEKRILYRERKMRKNL